MHNHDMRFYIMKRVYFFASTVIFPQKILFSYLHFHRIVLIYFM